MSTVFKWMSYKKQELLTLHEHVTWVHHQFLVGSMLLIFLVSVFCLSSSCVLFVFILCLVCPMLPVSLDCPFLIVSLGFSRVYFKPYLFKLKQQSSAQMQLISRTFSFFLFLVMIVVLNRWWGCGIGNHPRHIQAKFEFIWFSGFSKEY